MAAAVLGMPHSPTASCRGSTAAPGHRQPDPVQVHRARNRRSARRAGRDSDAPTSTHTRRAARRLLTVPGTISPPVVSNREAGAPARRGHGVPGHAVAADERVHRAPRTRRWPSACRGQPQAWEASRMTVTEAIPTVTATGRHGPDRVRCHTCTGLGLRGNDRRARRGRRGAGVLEFSPPASRPCASNTRST